MGEDLKTEPTQTKTSWIQRILLVFFGLGLFFLVFAGVEVVLRGLDIGDLDPSQDSFGALADGRSLFHRVEIAGRAMWRTRPEKVAFFNDQSFPVVKDPDTLRVFALGGSTTAGRPYDWQVAFPHWLQLIAEQAADRPVEVINAGGISYASYRVASLMRELLEYQPDVLVIYTGHNEFLEERTFSQVRQEAPWRRRLRQRVQSLHTMNVLRDQWQSLRGSAGEDSTEAPLSDGLTPEVKAKLDVWNGLDLFQRDAGLRRSVLDQYELQLRQMSSLALEHGVPLLWVRPISNIKDFSPFKSEPTEGLSAEQTVERERRVGRAKALMAGKDSGSINEAVELLASAVELDPVNADLHYLLAQALLQAGNIEAAEARFIEAKDLDVCPLRMLEEADRILLRVVAETEAAMFDLRSEVEAECRRRYGHSILGKELLADHVHPTIEAHQRIAVGLLAQLAQRGWLSLRPGVSFEGPRENPWHPLWLERIYEQQMSRLDADYYARRDLNLAKVLGWAGKYAEALEPLERAVARLHDDPEVFRNLGVVYQRVGRSAEALQAHQRAVELDPSIAESQLNLGVALAEVKQWPRAVGALRAAVELRPDYFEAQFNLALALQEVSRADEARELLQALKSKGWQPVRVQRRLALLDAEQNPDRGIDLLRAIDNPGIDEQVELARLLLRQKRFDEAETVLTRALELAPTEPRLHHLNGRRLVSQGDPEGAEASYRTALSLASQDSPALLNDLGWLLGRSKRLAEAEEVLLRALRLRPRFADAHYNLGLVYGNAGRLSDSRKHLQRALALDPENRQYGKALTTLENTLEGAM